MVYVDERPLHDAVMLSHGASVMKNSMQVVQEGQVVRRALQFAAVVRILVCLVHEDPQLIRITEGTEHSSYAHCS
jgi:hypothetical protein